MSENMNENMNEISLDKQDVSVEEPKVVEEVPVVEVSNEPIISMEKPVEPVQSVQQPVQPVQQPISTPIESVNVPNVNPYAFTPIEPKQKKKKEDLTTEELVLKQNNILKWLCLILCVFSVFSFCMSMASYNKTSKTELLVAGPSLSEPILTTVESGKEMSAAQIYAENIDSVVTIQTEIITQSFFQQYVGGATGSGFVISDDGYILTNAHVIEGANSIKVTFESGDTFSATLVGTEEDNDLAVIKIETPYVLNPVVMGDSDEVIIGEDVFAIGNPLGELTFSITKGIVSAINREIQIDTFNSINMFQVDCAVNEGNSGGPIFNNKGQVIGIVSAKYASETIEGLGFCIPITDALTIVTDLIEYGKVVDKAYMGVSVTDISETMVIQYNMVQGAYISIIDKGSCAEKAGLKVGDIIVELDGTKVDSVNALLLAKRGYRAGDTVSIKVWRSGDYVELKITFDEYVEEKVNNIQNNQQIQQYPNGFGGLEDFYNYYNQYGGNNSGSQSDNSALEDYLYEYFFGGQR